MGSIRGAYTGVCTPLPCDNPYMIRGRDGVCRWRKCGPGSILNPENGRCISKNTSAGRTLLEYKRNDLRDLRAEREKLFQGAKELEAKYNYRPYVGDTTYSSLFSKSAYTQRQQEQQARIDAVREMERARQKKIDERREMLEQIRIENANAARAYAAAVRDRRNMGW